MVIGDDLLVRKAELLGVLERLCQGLELSDSQFRTAKERYEAVGAWLAAAEDPMLRALAIYLQGSTALGTTVKRSSASERWGLYHRSVSRLYIRLNDATSAGSSRNPREYPS